MKFLKPVRSAADQFRYVMIGHVAHVVARLPAATADALCDAIPVIDDYRRVAAKCWKGGETASAESWQRGISAFLGVDSGWPLSRLPLLGLSDLHINIIFTMLMADEDSALAQLVEPDGGFPSLGGLIAIWRTNGLVDDPSLVRLAIADLVDLSLAVPVDSTVPSNEQRFRVVPVIAEILGGMQPHMPGVRFTPAANVVTVTEWISPDSGLVPPQAVASLLHQSANTVLVVRGHSHNGRKSYVHLVAHRAGLGTVDIASEVVLDPQKWRLAATLASLGNAMLLCELSPGPGETATLPNLAEIAPPVAIITGLSGAIHTSGDAAPLTIRIGLPERAARYAHWCAGGLSSIAADLMPMILPSGNIRRSAKAAGLLAGLDGEASVSVGHVRAALRNLRDARLDALATRIDVDRAPDPLFLGANGQEEFDALLIRCEQREQLGADDGNVGVRALLSGPSGTGKTLAASHIARRLGKDIFRVDLSATVNKYIGETEKALERLLSAAEELDVVLLLDEGDALMAKRTDVANSNDRYANLETNFLLQRIEQFSGIILITSNDADRIDGAFTRRMDAVIDFAAPDELRRQDILKRMLGDTKVSAGLLHDIACRCALTGGQLRNVVLHARLLSLDTDVPIGDTQLRTAIEREYRKIGSPCPLRRSLAAVG
jgi:ATPase family associated with various cellular activities (AAA)